MPAKALPLIVAAVVATGIVIYNNREQIIDLYERGREKLAKSLHKFADTLNPPQREAPHGYSDYEQMHEPRESFDERLRREEEAEGFLHSHRAAPRATGRAPVNSPDPGLRQRNMSGSHPNHQRGQVLYDSSLDGKGIPLEQINKRRYTGTLLDEKELPPPPLPPRRQPSPSPVVERTPSESGYGSERTVLVSPPIKPQPSPLSKAAQQSDEPAPPPTPSRSVPIIPIAAAAVAGAAVVGTAELLVPSEGSVVSEAATAPEDAGTPSEAVVPEESAAPLPYAEPQVQSRTVSMHSFSNSEPDIIRPNPFESTTQYMSIQEWANNASGSGSAPSTPTGPSEAGSVAGEVIDIPDVVSDFGSNSDGDFDETASWTEVGSETSENDY